MIEWQKKSILSFDLTHSLRRHTQITNNDKINTGNTFEYIRANHKK